MLNVQLTLADSESPKQFQLGEVLEEVSWETSLLDQPGKLTFSVLDNMPEMFFEGSNVVLTVEGTKVFDGYVFTRKRTEKDTMSVTAYDRLRYLQNKDVYVFENATPEEIFTKICKDHQLPYRIVSGSKYKTSPVVHDNKTLYSMIIRALDEAFIANGVYLMIRDNAGTLELVDIATLTTKLLIGDASLLTGFDFESSIDSETYNYIKLTQENKNKKVRNVYVVKDSSTINKWGRLQYYEKMDADANEAQIKEKANQLLRLYNRKTKSLKIDCLGDVRISAGCGVGLEIGKLSVEGVPQRQFVFVSKASHKISKEEYTMSLTLEVV